MTAISGRFARTADAIAKRWTCVACRVRARSDITMKIEIRQVLNKNFQV
jgi:cytochrome c551/c552